MLRVTQLIRRFYPFARRRLLEMKPREVHGDQFTQGMAPLNRLVDTLEKERVIGSAGGSIVNVTVDGHGTVQDISVQWEHQVIKNHPEVVTDLIRTATNEAIDKLADVQSKALMSHARELQNYGMGDVFGGN
eukprot:gb/GECG01001585.1/.p1 GENE.gb/GECG01001585.1/~~gb/GECG01001585.1/.p1  ORF type:complete len:132 (+),score=17.13 gb/GECG01001585.1/:1-396(+)